MIATSSFMKRTLFPLVQLRIEGYSFLVGLFFLWELFARKHWVDTNYFPSITHILKVLLELITSFEIIHHVLISLKRVFFGFFAGSVIGYVLGFLCGYAKIIYEVLELTIEFLRPMPSIALIPIGILFFGLGDSLNVAIIGYACSWPIFVNTMGGVRSIDIVYLRTAQSFGLNPLQIILRIIAPASLPSAFTGLRVGLGIAVAVVVITEMVASGNGLGAFIFNTSISFRIPEMYAGIIVIGLFGYALNQLFFLLERFVLRWHYVRSSNEHNS